MYLNHIILFYYLFIISYHPIFISDIRFDPSLSMPAFHLVFYIKILVQIIRPYSIPFVFYTQTLQIIRPYPYF